ncbi:MAG TPA: hypothetical protein EYP35_11265 [Desulfobacterales bacterium]|nr:hypothetical protein [Desulfobacterales bacterium]
MGFQQDLSQLPVHFHLLIPMNISPEEVRRLLGVMALVGIPPTSIYLHIGWELFLDISFSEHSASIFKNVAKVYVYVDNTRESKALLRLITSKPLSKFKMLVTMVYYVTSAYMLKEIVSTYDWDGAPHILVIVRVDSSSSVFPSLHQLEAALELNNFSKTGNSEFVGLPVKWYADSKGRKWVGLVVLKGDEGLFGEGLVVLVHPLHVHSDLIALIKDHISVCSIREQPSNIIELLCSQALWRVKIEAVVNGVPVLDEDLYEILKALKKLKTLRAACKYVNKSYPTIKNKITEVERTLGVNIVKSARGGARRGFSELTIDGELLAEIYEELKRRIEKELERYVEDVCRKIGVTMKHV